MWGSLRSSPGDTTSATAVGSDAATEAPPTPSGIRFQRRAMGETATNGPPSQVTSAGPPLHKPPPADDEDKYQSLMREKRGRAETGRGLEGRGLAAERVKSPSPTPPPPPPPRITSPPVPEQEERERKSYVEEPPSAVSTLRRPAKQLVQRIASEMQMAQYIQKVEIGDIAKAYGAYTPPSTGVYRIPALRFFESGVRRALWFIGKSIANHKLLFAVLPLTLILLSLLGPVVVRQSPLAFHLPFAGLTSLPVFEPASSGVSVGSLAPPPFNHSHVVYNAIGRMRPENFQVIMHNKNSKETILRGDTVHAYVQLKRKLEAITVSGEKWSALCGDGCDGDKDILDRIIRKSPEVSLTYPETFVATARDSSNLTRLYLANAIAGVDTDSDGAISRAAGLLASFQLKDGLDMDTIKRWDAAFRTTVTTENIPASLLMTRWSPFEFATSVVATLKSVYNKLPLAGLIVVVVCIAVSFDTDAYQSKPLVGVQMGVCCLLVAAAGVVVPLSAPAPFHALVYPTIFIASACALFVLHSLAAGWRQYSAAALHPAEKLAFVLSHSGAGPAIGCCVMIGALAATAFLSPVPLMSSSLSSLACALAALLLLACLYIGVFVYIGGRREAKGCKWYHFFRTGDTHFPLPTTQGYDASAIESLHDRLVDARPTVARRIGSLLVSPALRYPLVFLCTAYIIFAIWGCVNVRVSLREDDFLPSESTPAKFLAEWRTLFSHSDKYLQLDFHRTVDYFDPAVRETIMQMIDHPVADQYASRAVSWLADFARFEKQSIYDINQDTFVPVVNLVFLTSEPFRRFASDLTFDRFQTQITRSRMYLELTPKGIQHKNELVESILSKARQFRLPVTVTAPFVFSIQHDLQALSSFLSCFGIMLVVSTALSLLLLGQPALTLLCVSGSAATLAATIGYAAHLSVPLNTVTFTVALTANTLTTLLIIVFCYSYSLSGKGQQRPQQRVQYTCQACLLPALAACALPTVAYLPLLAVDAPVVIHVWKMLLLSSAASAIHLLFFLPNLLILLSEHLPMCTALSCAECCCDMEDDSSIYYIPTTGRAIHPENIYQHASYTYSLPHSIAPPGYRLAIAAPEKSMRRRAASESSLSDVEGRGRTTMRQEGRRGRRAVSRDDSIYEAMPQSRNVSRRSSRRDGDIEGTQQPNWGQFMQSQRHTQNPPFMFYPNYNR